MDPVQRLADKVECELMWGTTPTLIAAMISPSLRVVDVVSALSRFGFNATATRLYEAFEAQKETTA